MDAEMRATLEPATPPPARFDVWDARRAGAEWGANCGPGAAAAILMLTLDEVRAHFVAVGFEQKRYTNPSMMFALLRRVGARWHTVAGRPGWPRHGLVRVQWEGPWTAQGVPMAARYRHTHWVGAHLSAGETQVFDINCICVGGWISLQEWSGKVVPWLLGECEPKANGRWHITHAIEVY
jgi:hypothetical protein